MTVGRADAPRDHGRAPVLLEPAGLNDAVTLVTIELIALFAVPAPMVITALGQIGGPATVIALVAFMIWLVRVLGLTPQEQLQPSAVRRAAFIFLGTMLLAYAHSAMLPLPGDERSPADAALLRLVGLIGLVALITDFTTTRERLWTLVERISIALGLLSLLAVFQLVSGQTLVDSLSIPGLSRLDAYGLDVRGLIVRPSATATHAIEFAVVLAMGLPICLAAAQHTARRARLHTGIATLVAVMMLMTGSRTAIVCGATAVIAMFPAWRWHTRVVAVGFTLMCLTGLFIARPGFVGTLRGLFQGAADDPSVLSRTNSYAVAEAFWQRQPLLGRGMGTLLPKYWIFDNQYLLLVIGAGLVGVVALLGLVAVAIWTCSRTVADTALANERYLAAAIRSGILAGAVGLALFDMFSFPQAVGTFFLLLGLAGALRRLTAVDERPHRAVAGTGP